MLSLPLSQKKNPMYYLIPLDILLQIGMSLFHGLFDPVTISNDKFFSSHPQFCGSRFLPLLHDIVMDSFDDVRLIASSVQREVLCRMHEIYTSPDSPFCHLLKVIETVGSIALFFCDQAQHRLTANPLSRTPVRGRE